MEVSFLTWQFFNLFPLETFKAANPPRRLSHRTIAERHFGSLPSILCDALGRVKTKRPPKKKLEKDRKVSFFLANLWKINYIPCFRGFKLMEINVAT